MSSEAQILLNLKDKIDKSEKKMSMLEGEREGKIKVLVGDFGCKTMKEAKKLLTEGRQELAKNKELLADKIEALEEDYEW